MTLFVPVLAGTVGVVWMGVRRRGVELRDAVKAQYRPPPDAPQRELSRHEEHRVREVARWWAYHELVEQRSLARVGVLALLMLPGIAIGIAGAATGCSRSTSSPSWASRTC